MVWQIILGIAKWLTWDNIGWESFPFLEMKDDTLVLIDARGMLCQILCVNDDLNADGTELHGHYTSAWYLPQCASCLCKERVMVWEKKNRKLKKKEGRVRGESAWLVVATTKLFVFIIMLTILWSRLHLCNLVNRKRLLTYQLLYYTIVSSVL